MKRLDENELYAFSTEEVEALKTLYAFEKELDNSESLPWSDNDIIKLKMHYSSKLAKETVASDLHQTLLSSFANIERQEARKESCDGFDGPLTEFCFPSYYGGCYIDTSGELVIYITEEIDSHKRLLEGLLKTDEFLVKKSMYSYRDLLEIVEKITNDIHEGHQKHPYVKKLVSIGILEKENRVVVGLDAQKTPIPRRWLKTAS